MELHKNCLSLGKLNILRIILTYVGLMIGGANANKGGYPHICIANQFRLEIIEYLSVFCNTKPN